MGWVRRPRGGRGWEARYRGSDGRERSRTFRTKADAQRFLAGIEAQLHRGEWRDPALARTTFGDWAAEWMTTTVHLRPSTQASYAYLLRVHVLPRFGPCQLGRITPVDVRMWLPELKGSKLSPSTVRKAFGVLRRALAVAIECELIAHSPCATVKPPPEPSHEMTFLRFRVRDLCIFERHDAVAATAEYFLRRRPTRRRRHAASGNVRAVRQRHLEGT